MEKFPVNSGNIPPPPPSHSTNVPVKHAPSPNLQINRAQNAPVANGNRRRRKEPSDTPPMLKLERIIGLTSNSRNMIASDPSSDQVAYAAGAVIILYNYRKNKQVAFLYPPPSVTNVVATGTLQPTTSMISTIPAWSTTAHPSAAEWATPTILGNEMKYPMQDSDENNGKKRTSAGSRPKTISCLAFSTDGNYLAAGEVGHQPRIFVWNVKQETLVCVLKGHKFGIVSVAFSSDMRHLASVGFQHDGYLNVWNWRKGTKVASNRVTSRVHAMEFAKDGSHFITAGLRHIKFWNLSSTGKTPLQQSNFQSAETQVLDGRSGLLGSLRNNNFVDAAYDPENPGTAYLLSETGLLCMFKEERILDKWVDLQVKIAFSIDVSNRYIICACDNGIVRLFEPGTLRYCGMLPRPHPLGIDLSSFVTVQQLESIRDTAVYPDTLAIKFDATSNKVTCIYSDRSLIIWDVKHLQRIAMYRSFISHSECVWGTERFPHPAAISEHTNRRQHITEYESLTNSTLPPYTFASHSADGTVRFWNIDSGLPTSDLTMSPGSTSPTSPPPSYPSLVSPPLSLIASASMKSTFPSTEADVQISMRRNIFSKELIKMLYLDPEAAEFARNNKDIEIAELPDHGIRALKISSDGSLLATGDRKGNLRVHRISDWQEVTYLEAHDSEILTIDFSTPTSNGQPFLIASASRDRLIHVFDIQKDFKLLQTMDDHSSSITAVKFSSNGSKLVSCSADKSVIFRSANTQTLQQSPLYTSYHNHSGRATVFDMELDLHDKYIVMVTGERRLNLLSLETGKLFRTCKPETMEEDVNGMTLENSGGSLIDIDLDCISGTFAVTAGSDKCVRLFDLMNGVCVHKVAAHSELVTSVRFLDGPHGILRVVSTSSDGSIFVWRVDPEVTKKMHQRAKDRNDQLRQTKPEAATEGTQLRATAPPSPQTPKPIPRLRRTSAVPAFQSGNQNIKTERKSFSHVSKSEAKYDDIYKKLERTPPPKLQTDAPQSPVLAGRIKGRISSPAPRDVNAKGVLTSVSTPRLINAEANARNSQWRGNFMSRKKEPSGSPSSPNQESKTGTGISSLFPQRQSRNSPRLRHRVSHDVLIQHRRGSFASTEDNTNISSQRQSYANTPRAMAHRRSNSSACSSANEVDEPVTGSTSMPDLQAIAESRIGKITNEITTDPESTNDSDTEKSSLYDEAPHNQTAASIDEDYDDQETVEDDSMVYLTPVVDTADPKPFQVEKADQGNLDEADGDGNDKDDDDSQNMHSDTDISSAPSQTFNADDSDSSSEDNADEALVESIAMRNPPPMSTLRKASLKKSGRMSLRSIVRSFNTVKSASEPSPPPQSSHNRGESFTNFKRKMEQAKKRLSFSTRYLSNLHPQSPPTDSIKIEDGVNIRSMSMPIAPQASANHISEATRVEPASPRVPLILTDEELADINNVHPASDRSTSAPKKSIMEPGKESRRTSSHIPTQAHAFDHESMLSELSSIGGRLESFLKMCEGSDVKNAPIFQDDVGKQLKAKMEHVQKTASRILEEIFDTPQRDHRSAMDSPVTTALLNEYSDKLVQMFESKLDLKRQSD